MKKYARERPDGNNFTKEDMRKHVRDNYEKRKIDRVRKRDLKIQYLNQENDNTVQMVNPYTFNNINYNSYKKIGVNRGTYTLTGITTAHPIGFVINDTDKFEVISGTTHGTKQVNGIDVTHYTGTVKFKVKRNFGVISYHCFNHGFMGGENRLVYSRNSPRLPDSEGTFTDFETEYENIPDNNSSRTYYTDKIGLIKYIDLEGGYYVIDAGDKFVPINIQQVCANNLKSHIKFSGYVKNNAVSFYWGDILYVTSFEIIKNPPNGHYPSEFINISS